MSMRGRGERSRGTLQGAVLVALLGACGDDGGPATGTTGPGSSTTEAASTGTPPAESSDSGSSSTGSVDGTSSSSGAADSEGSSSTTGAATIVDEGCPECTVLVDGLTSGRGIAVDDAFVYFTDQSAGNVGRIQKNGGEGGVLVSAQDSPYDIAIDATHVYWTNYVDAGAVMRVPKEGGAAETVSTSLRPRAIAVDESHVYWGTFDELQGDLYRRDVMLSGSAELIADMSAGIAELALGKGRLYFTAHATSAGATFIAPPKGPPIGAIYYVALGGNIDPQAPPQVATEQAEPWGLAYQPGGRLFWANGDGVGSNDADSIVSLPPGGSPVVITQEPSAPWGVAVDESWVYWTDAIYVAAAPADGGDTVLLADLQNNARSITVDADWVYWITKNRVLQRPKP
jgi:sugar lactone lactonase YvrE